LFDLSKPPRLIKPGFQGGVQPQDEEETLAWGGLNPVVFLALWRGWPEIDVYRAVGVGSDISL